MYRYIMLTGCTVCMNRDMICLQPLPITELQNIIMCAIHSITGKRHLIPMYTHMYIHVTARYATRPATKPVVRFEAG